MGADEGEALGLGSKVLMSSYFNPARGYTCTDVKEVLDVECCGSCHNEWDDGYGEPLPLTKRLSDGEYVEFAVCCTVGGGLSKR